VDLERLKIEVNRLPQQILQEFIDLGLDELLSRQIISDKELLPMIELLKEKMDLNAKFIKTLVNEKSARSLTTDQLVDLASLTTGETPSNLIRQIIIEANETGKLPSEISVDQGDSSKIIEKVLSDNPDAVEKYKSGKKEIVGFLIGQVMREMAGKANPNEIRELLIKEIEVI